MQVAAVASLGTHDELLRDGQLGEDRITHVPGLRENGEKRMRRIAFALGLAALLAGDVGAATYYVSTTGTTNNPGTLAQPWSLAKANSTLSAGDAAILLPGTYTAGIAPANSGTSQSQRIHYVGALDNPGLTIVASLTLTKNYISVKGIKASTMPSAWTGAFDSIYSCVIVNPDRMQIGTSAHYNTISNSTVNTPKFFIAQQEAALDSTRTKTRAFRITDSRLTISGTGYLFKVQGTESLTVLRSSLYLTCTGENTNGGGWLKIYDSRHATFENCLIDFTNQQVAACNECGWSYHRDSVKGLRYTRCKFVMRGPGHAEYIFSASGTYVGQQVGNKWDQCEFRSDAYQTPGGIGVMARYQSYSQSDTITNNLFVASKVGAFSQISGNSGNLVDQNGMQFKGNTIVGLSDSYPTINNSSLSGPGSTSDTWHNNIIYSARSYLLDDNYYNPSMTGDYDLVYTQAHDSTLSCINSSRDPDIIFPWKQSYYSVWDGGETYSQFLDPLFVSPMAATALGFDGHVSSTSPALTAGDTGGRVGAFGVSGTQYVWVAPNTRTGLTSGLFQNTGADSAHPVTLAAANVMARPGMTFVLLSGDYSANSTPGDTVSLSPTPYAVGVRADLATNIAPLSDGLGLSASDAIRYVSLWYYKAAILGTPAAVDTTNYKLGGITIGRQYVSVGGFACDSIRVVTYAGSAPSGYLVYSEFDSLTYCKARTVNVIGARNVTMRNCWVISPYVATASGAANARNSLSGAIEFKFLSGVWHTYLVQNQIGISIAGQSNGVQFTRSRLEGILTPAAQTPDTCAFIRMSRSVNLHVDTCTVKVNCFTAGETSPAWSVDSLTARAFDLRDDAQYISMVSDTMNLGTRSGNLATVLIGTAGGPINNVVIQDCIIAGDWALVPRIRSSAWSLLRSALGSKRGTPVYWGATAGTSTSASKSDSITISQCSFYADSLANGKSQPVLALLLDQSADLVQVNRNIFYRLKTTAASSTGDTCGAIVRYGNVAYSTGFSTDANLYFTPSDSSQNAVYCEGWTRTGYGPNCAARIDYGTNPAPPCIKDNIKTQTSAVLSTEGALALNTDEENSYWGTPSFIDASVDSAFDGRIYCSSVTSAYVPNWVGSFGDSAVGANQPQFNVTPSVCTALDTTAATAATLAISFTSGANDGATNRGSPAGYYVRYGTNPALSEGTYTTATVSPGSPGATITATLTSLSANTTYYFAVITVGRCGDQSPLSAIQCGVTRKSTGQSGGDICREN